MSQSEIERGSIKSVADILFCGGAIKEPQTDVTRRWLVKQLQEVPNRVHHDKTCSIGQLQKLATCDYPFVIAELEALRSPTEPQPTRQELVEFVTDAAQPDPPGQTIGMASFRLQRLQEKARALLARTGDA